MERCLKDGCDYDLLLTLKINKSSPTKELTLDVFQIGGMQNEQTISSFKFYIPDHEPITYAPDHKVSIFQEGRQIMYFD